MTKILLWILLFVEVFSLRTSATYNSDYYGSPRYTVDNQSELPQPEIQLLREFSTTNNCSSVSDKNSSSEFPPDLFTEEQRDHGAVILHFIAALYCFGMIGIVCGDYFLPSVDCICCYLKLSQDVAAATFMSFATCTPEFFTILIGTFITETDIGLGAVVGSGMFNILGVATCGGLAACKSIKLDWWPLFRDSVIYVGALTVLVIVISDNVVTLWESIALFICYILYFVIMAFNQKLRRFVKGCVRKVQRRATQQSTASTNSTALPLSTVSIVVSHDNQQFILNNNNNNNINSNILQTTAFNSPLTEKDDLDEDELGNGTYKPYFIMYGEARRLSKKSTLSEFSFVGRRPSKKSCHSDILPISNKQNNHVLWAEVYDEIMHTTMKNSAADDNTIGKNIFHFDGSLATTETVADNMTEDATNPPEKADTDQKIWQMPDGSVWESIFWLVMLPASFLFYITIPDCRNEKLRKFYPVTFLMCIVWIGITSYLGTWMISVLGDTIGIPDSVMGLTFLAAGGSMPEAISTVIMARQGVGGMGFSNSLGGNTMDICLCLAVPWLIKCSLSSYVYVESSGLQYNCIALFIGIIVLLFVASLTKFHMNKKLGVACFLCYLVFIVMSILIEIGVIIKVCNPAPTS